MKNDWRLIRILLIIIILCRGFYNLNSFINQEKFNIFNISLNYFWYSPFILIAFVVLISSCIFFLLKGQYAGKILSVSMVIDGLFLIIYSFIVYVPVFMNSWYFLILGIVIGLLELRAGKTLLIELK